MSKYNIYKGSFNCHICKEEVKVLRMYEETTDVTWMCSKKHISKVTIVQRRRP
jgi:hypothetical protein